MRIEPSIYLDALMNDFLLWGGKVVIRKFDTPRDVAALSENVIVNCTGLGAKALFSDPELMPLKGQLVVLVPQPEITYGTSGVGTAAAAGCRLRAHDAALGRHHPRRHVDPRQLVDGRRGEGPPARRRRAHRVVRLDEERPPANATGSRSEMAHALLESPGQGALWKQV